MSSMNTMSEYDSEDSFSGSDDEDDSYAESMSGVDMVDNKLDELRVGGNMGIYRMFEGTFGSHVRDILFENCKMSDAQVAHVLWRYMYDEEWQAFQRAMAHNDENFMSDVVGLVYLFASYFNINVVNVGRFMAHMMLETCKPVRTKMVRTSPMLSKIARAQLIQ